MARKTYRNDWKLWLSMAAAFALGAILSGHVKAAQPLEIVHHNADKYVDVRGEPHHVRMFVESWWTATWKGSYDWKTDPDEHLRRQVEASFRAAEKGSVLLYCDANKPEDQLSKSLQAAINEYLNTKIIISRPAQAE